jgi:hypothetical protein
MNHETHTKDSVTSYETISGGEWLIDMKPHDVFNSLNFENVHPFSTTLAPETARRTRHDETAGEMSGNPSLASPRWSPTPLLARP